MALNNEVSILNIANIDNDIKDASTRGMIAAEEKMEYATRNYDVNEYFIWNDRKLYKTKQQIGVGNNFVIDVNIKYIGSIATQLYDLYSQSPDTIRQMISNLELTANASQAYDAGEYIIMASDGFLYRLTRDVDLGTLWNVGYNIEKVDNVTELVNELEDKTDVTRTLMAPIQATNKAIKNYAVGEQFIFNNQLVKATSAIALNATITLNGNCTPAGSVTSQISNLATDLNGLSKLKAIDGPTTGSLLSWIENNCTDNSLTVFQLGDTSNLTDVPTLADGSYSTSFCLSRSSVKYVFLTSYNSYNTMINIHVNNAWSGWKNLYVSLPTQRNIIIGSSSYYTVEQDAQYVESYYYRRFGMMFASINVKAVTPQNSNTVVFTLPPSDNFTTINGNLVAEDDSVLHFIFQSGSFYLKGGVAGKTYRGYLCYPIA